MRPYLDHLGDAFHWIRREFLTIVRLEFVSESWRASLAYALRGWLGCVLALYLAYFFQLDQPYWAGMTAWLAMQPTPGAALSRCFYRILGSIIGAAMGVVLISLFAQTPVLFIIAFALWMGLATLAANLVTNFRSYGAITAGFTAGIVALGAYQTPDKVFDIAMSRGSATILGIICSAGITAIFARQRGREKVLGLIRQAISDTARRAAFPFNGSVHDRIALGRPTVASLISLDTEIEFAAVESAEFRIHAGLSRSLVAHLFAVIAEKRSLEDHLKRVGPIQDAQTIGFLNTTMKLLEGAPALIAANQWKELLELSRAQHLQIAEYEPPALDLPCAVSTRYILDRLNDLLSHFERAAVDWTEIQGGWTHDPNLSLNFHRDRLSAFIHASRAVIAVLAAGAFWIASAWSSGSLMLIQLAVTASFFSYVPRPEVQSFNFFKGAVFASISAYICTYHVLPYVADYTQFALVQAVFLIPGALFLLNPKYTGIGFAYCVLFMVVERPLNPMDYDAVSFFNNAVATILGTGCGVLTYLLFFPDNRRLARWYVIFRTRQGLKNIAATALITPYWAWQTRMFDRINRLYNPDKAPGAAEDESYDGGVGALSLGNDLLRLRHLLNEGISDAQARELAQELVQSFSMIMSQPELTHSAARKATASLKSIAPPAETVQHRAWLRLIGVAGEIRAFFVLYPNFLKQGRLKLYD
ncbi:MAG TPA: FUSC family protein [Pseudomonadales bacterium]|nr:FUSC family protein [Pseudomonadales bacterium]